MTVHLAWRNPDTGEPTLGVCVDKPDGELTLEPADVTCIQCAITGSRRWML